MSVKQGWQRSLDDEGKVQGITRAGMQGREHGWRVAITTDNVAGGCGLRGAYKAEGVHRWN